MYELGTAALLGLAVFALVEAIGYFAEASRGLRLFLGLLLALLLAWVIDYSLFSGWGVELRSDWMGPVLTGLTIGGIAGLWHDLVRAVRGYAARSRDLPVEVEPRSTRTAA